MPSTEWRMTNRSGSASWHSSSAVTSHNTRTRQRNYGRGSFGLARARAAPQRVEDGGSIHTPPQLELALQARWTIPAHRRGEGGPVAVLARDDQPFFAAGACHILARAFMRTHPASGFEIHELSRPRERDYHHVY